MPGIYEQSDNGKKSYFAVIGRRIVPLGEDVVEKLRKFCLKYGYSWIDLVENWMTSTDKTADGLANLIAEWKREEEAERRKRRVQLKPQLEKQAEQSSAAEVFEGSDGSITRRYLTRLEQLGDEGRIAAELFRVQKSSSRAKVYRGKNGGKYRDHAYDRKSEAMERLTERLGTSDRFRWGWKLDPESGVPWVLYVDLPQGQVSFHSLERGNGPDYPGDWDRKHVSASRILEFCDSLLNFDIEQRCGRGQITREQANTG